MKQAEYDLYFVADPDSAGTRSIERIVERAISGGATIVQLREKSGSTKGMIERAKRLRAITRKARIPLLINDRIDVALAAEADGVHVGQDDMPAVLARKMIGPKKILGVSAKTVAEARQAEKDGADYVGVGDIFGTRSKADAGKPIGLDMMRRIARAVSIPVVGIGAVSVENAAQVIAAGADGIAVISAIVRALNPAIAARELRGIVGASLKARK